VGKAREAGLGINASRRAKRLTDGGWCNPKPPAEMESTPENPLSSCSSILETDVRDVLK